MHRNTYVEVSLDNISKNIKNIIKNYNNYKYYFGVVKADAYSHGINVVETIINSGCNYLAVATIDEALEIRNINKDIPILCLGITKLNDIQNCIDNNITITISNLEYLKELIKLKHDNLKVHIKINTGMNRLGFDSKNEFNEAYNLINNSSLILEGIFTHIYEATNKNKTLKQYKLFEEITSNIDLYKIPIVHTNASDATMLYKKLDYANGCRLGISMYGFSENKNIKLDSTFKLISEVIQINNVKNGTVGYNGIYKVDKPTKIAVIPIGYADGIIRKYTGGCVYINDKKYKIVGNVCMDMLFVKIDNNVKIGDKVLIIKDNDHILKISKQLDTIPYEIICNIGKRVPRIYTK